MLHHSHKGGHGILLLLALVVLVCDWESSGSRLGEEFGRSGRRQSPVAAVYDYGCIRRLNAFRPPIITKPSHTAAESLAEIVSGSFVEVYQDSGIFRMAE